MLQFLIYFKAYTTFHFVSSRSSNFCPFTFTDDVGRLFSPGEEFRGSRHGQRNVEWEDGDRQTDPLISERWSSATLKVLSSMPSRTIGEFC